MMKSQVGCTTVRLVRDNKSIKTIMVPRPSYQTRLNQAQIRPNQETYHIYDSRFLVPKNLEAAGALTEAAGAFPQQMYIYHLSR